MENIVELEVRWGECDPFQIVFYPNFFAWYDHCAWKLFEAAGFGPKLLKERFGYHGMPLVDAQSKFIRPVRARDRLTITSRITHWGRTSFKITHRIAKDGEPMAEGVETRVWTIAHPDDPTRPKPAPIPRGLIEAMDR